jgi:cathepsin F
MKALLLVLCIVVLASCSDLRERKFQRWMRKHNKNYDSEEYARRFENFKGTLEWIKTMNRKQPLAKYDLDEFADLTLDEFRLRLMKPFDANNTCRWPYHKVAPLASDEALKATPTNYDWRTKGVVTIVKNQGSCGSCWTFSTAENIEGQWAMKNPLANLSEQWIVDCSHSCLASESDLCDGGCGGGLPWLAYEDIITNGFLTTEVAYPYTGEQGTCESPSTVGAKISNWTAVSIDPQQIQAFAYQRGPLSITLNAGLLFSYSSGIITGSPDDCPNSESDHAVLMVGWGTDAGTGTQFWIVKNSWGVSWGENGYFRIESDNGLCGINACVTSSTL